MYVLNMINNGDREIGLVLAIKFFPKKTSPGQVAVEFHLKILSIFWYIIGTN